MYFALIAAINLQPYYKHHSHCHHDFDELHDYLFGMRTIGIFAELMLPSAVNSICKNGEL